MKRFHFPLERVRRWRSEQANLEELHLQQIRAELETLAAAKTKIQQELTDTAQQLFARQSIDPLELESLDSYRYYVRGRVRDFEQQERQAAAKAAEQRQKVIEARQRFELLDRLKNSALSHWKADAAKEQEDLAAELFLARGSRRAQ